MKSGTVLCRRADLKHTRCKSVSFGEFPEKKRYFVIESGQAVYGYINSCPHTGAPLNWLPDQFFDSEGQYIQCSLHGALFEKHTGLCIYGPCRGASLSPVAIRIEQDDTVVLD